ncbi:MAG: hypothetical protein ACFCVG_00055 [Kineosporiaceae bacterium]
MASTMKRRRSRGSIDQLPSGAFRVRVAAGVDPVTGGGTPLVELAESAVAAEKVRTRLLAQVDERRNPRTRTSVDALLERYLDVTDVGPVTRRSYERFIRNHISPALEKLSVNALDVEHLDRFYGPLRTCRAPVPGRGHGEPPDRSGPRVRRSVPPPPLHADGRVRHPADPLD